MGVLKLRLFIKTKKEAIMDGKVKQTLHWCVNCKEHSIIRRCYMRQADNRMGRMEFCLNKSCGYKLNLPFRVLTEEEKTIDTNPSLEAKYCYQKRKMLPFRILTEAERIK